MLKIQHHQESIERRLFVIGMPSYTIKPFVAMLSKWEQHSGFIWVIKRLKSLKIDLIRRRAGLEPLTWIRRNRKGDISGVIGSIFRWSDKSEKTFALAVQAFMAYSFYILPSLTEEQKEKFLSAIGDDPDFVSPDHILLGVFNSSRDVVGPHRISSEVQPLVAYTGSPSKKAPRLFGRQSVPQSSKVLDDLLIFNMDCGIKLFSEFEELFTPLLQGLQRLKFLKVSSRNYRRLLSLGVPSIPTNLICGEVHFLQEPGGKLRSVASPFRILQEVLRPLGNSLYGIVQALPWDCTFDQSKAIPHIQNHLQNGLTAHSIDLSSATDRFPLDLQLTCLRAILPQDQWNYISLFEQVSRGNWSSILGNVKWVKGQPLGLFPSFALFTLTHGLLLHYLNHGWHHDFFIVGDDVIILNDELKDKYILTLSELKCPISYDKSLSSNKLSEFTGKVITPSRVIPQMKWRRMSDDNFLDLCKLIGPKSRCLLTSRQKVVFDSVKNLLLPIGLNFSLPGDSLTKMVERTLSFYRPEEAVLGSLMGLRERLNKVVHSSTESFDSDELRQICSAFDEKVISVLKKTIFYRWSLLGSISLDAFSSLPQALDLRPRLPFLEFSSTRKTTLERYECLLTK